jgi:asparagine synthase (glutamine-hydrolysing)
MSLIERLKKTAGAANGMVSGALNLIHKLNPEGRFGKFLPLLDVPFESYYYSRTATPFRFFNEHYREVYSDEFGRSVDKEYSALPATKLLEKNGANDVLSRMLYVDTKTWLPDDLLVKADKITMANSIELRVPLLDHKVLEFAATLPSDFKVHGSVTKYIAKRCLTAQVPQEILDRKKAGFPVPYTKWLRTELRDTVRNILLDRQSIARGYFRKSAVERMLKENVDSGAHMKEVFCLTVLELWHREFLQPKPGLYQEPSLAPANISA